MSRKSNKKSFLSSIGTFLSLLINKGLQNLIFAVKHIIE